MSQRIRRKYNYSDAIILAHTGKLIHQLPDDLPVIEAIIPIINQPFLDGLKADYELALAEGGDDVVKGQVGQKTQSLLNAMESCKAIVKKLRFWVPEAFPDNPAKQKSFNLKKYWTVANSQPGLIKFMNGLTKPVEENRQALQDAGTPLDLLDGVAINAKALAEADAVQESSKGGRANATQARILALNSIYERCMKLDRATDIAFEDDPVRAAFYDMPQTAPKPDEVDDLVTE